MIGTHFDDETDCVTHKYYCLLAYSSLNHQNETIYAERGARKKLGQERNKTVSPLSSAAVFGALARVSFSLKNGNKHLAQSTATVEQSDSYATFMPPSLNLVVARTAMQHIES